MDISAEIAAIQAASQGSELRQPLVGALNKLNSGTLPTVTSSDAGKILKVGANGWEVGEKSGYMPVPTDTMQITDNDTYDVTNYASVVVNVSGGGGGSTQNPFVVDASSTYSGANLSAQNAFGINTSNYWGSNGATSDWLRMHFLEPVSISKVSFTNTYISGNLHLSSQRIVFQYSDDNNVWNDLFDKANLSDSTSNLFEETIQNSGKHLYYRFLCYRSSSYYAGIGKVVVNVSDISSALIPKIITQNGTYDPADDNADGYSEVTVNVPKENPFLLTDYIESSGTQYIDTGYLVKDDTEFEMVVNFSNTGSYPTIFGVREVSRTDASGLGSFICSRWANNTYASVNWGSQMVNTQSLINHYGKKCLVEFDKGKKCFFESEDGYFAGGYFASTASATQNFSLYIFTLNTGGTIEAVNWCAMKLYCFRIFESGVLVHEFIPWQENGVACLKDTVTSEIKYNAGTGDFVYGTDVV